MSDPTRPTADPTEVFRRVVQARTPEHLDREALEDAYGMVWDTRELQEEFAVNSFLAPFVYVTRRSDGAAGTLQFQNSPRFYWGFHPSGR